MQHSQECDAHFDRLQHEVAARQAAERAAKELQGGYMAKMTYHLFPALHPA